MKKVIIIVLILAGLAGGALAIFRRFEKKDTAMNLETEQVIRGTINELITSTGTLEALETVEVGTQVSGIIDKIFVDYNSNVKKGQLLAKIDETPLVAQLEQSQASVESAEAEANYQEATYKRYKALAEKQLIAESDYEQVEYNYRKALAALKNARSVHERNQINLGYATITSPIDGIILDRAVDEGQTVAASFSTPTMFTIANDLTQMQVEASVDEADIGRLQMGQRVEFTVDAYPEMKFSGEVTEIRLLPVETSNVITYTVVVDAPNDDLKLMPGMTANLSFFVMEKKDIVLMPAGARTFMPDPASLQAYQEQHPEVEVKMPMGPGQGQGQGAGQGQAPGGFPSGAAFAAPPAGAGMAPAGDETTTRQLVWVKRDNVIEPVMVELGDTDELHYEVLSGLQAGDEVITSLGEEMSFPAGMPQMPSNGTRSPFMPQRPGGGGNPPRGN
ncbi:MAG: efflux RND transporter periplasmic adaptor subunit [Bacteroidales bacterium]